MSYSFHKKASLLLNNFKGQNKILSLLISECSSVHTWLLPFICSCMCAEEVLFVCDSVYVCTFACHLEQHDDVSWSFSWLHHILFSFMAGITLHNDSQRWCWWGRIKFRTQPRVEVFSHTQLKLCVLLPFSILKLFCCHFSLIFNNRKGR